MLDILHQVAQLCQASENLGKRGLGHTFLRPALGTRRIKRLDDFLRGSHAEQETRSAQWTQRRLDESC